ncbi:flagellar biosynthesis anti-sigma factor FlgM [Pantoea sp. EABMAA-21]|uniref:flagellar biosynthesis anti-sigma factor FlgM n=1 Tax=Pantoea sp. EABMAA-21 TaxID=3043302 RepID=UPI0024B61782|nr:flagellar biosynthesis anti-sigma factor FlgM [Pantoea sp. EABMAA-21]MDI9279074.1 flagellar biosynthesis anti-sigma factor FlgM [Pantoea sp. EABMAA-21]
MIDRTQPVSPIAGTHELPARSSPQSLRARPDAERQSTVSLSSVMKQLQTDDSRDVNVARVVELRTALEAGDLPIAVEEIARGMVHSLISPQQ